MKKIARMGLLKLFSSVIIRLFGLVSVVFIARYLSPEILGIFAFTLSYVALFSNIGDLGLGSAHAKRINQGLDQAKCNGAYYSLAGITIIIFNLAVIFSLFIQDELKYKNYILLALVITNMELLNKVCRASLHANLNIAISVIPRIIGRFIQMVFKVATIVLVGSLFYLYVANMIGLAIIMLFYIYYLYGIKLAYPSIGYIKKYLSFGFPVFIINFIGSLYMHGVIILVYFFMSETDVGIFFVAKTFSGLLIFFTTSLSLVLFVNITRYVKDKNFEKINKMSHNYDNLMSLLLLPFVIFLIVLCEEITTFIFGMSFNKAAQIIPFFLISYYSMALNSPHSNLLMTLSKFRLIILFHFFSLLIFFVSFIYLVPTDFMSFETLGLGFYGIGISLIILYLSRLFFNRVYVYSLYAIKPNIKLLYHWFSGIVCYIVISSIKPFFLSIPIPDIIVFGVIFILCTLFFLAVLRLTNQFGIKEMNVFMNIIDYNKFGREIRDELSNKSINL